MTRLAWILRGIAALALAVALPWAWPAVVFPAGFVGLLLLATVGARRLPLAEVGRAAALGASFSCAVVLVLCGLFARGLDPSHNPFKAVAVPLVEELAKAAPLALFLLRRRDPAAPEPLACDLLVLGAAAGAGFEVVEDALRAFSRSVPPPDLLAGHLGTPHYGPLFPFPDLVASADRDGYRYFLGHSAATAFVGLALGLGRERGGRARFLVPLAAFLWVALDHAFFNFDPARGGSWREPVRTAHLWLGRGLPAAIALYFGVALAVVRRRWAGKAMPSPGVVG